MSVSNAASRNRQETHIYATPEIQVHREEIAPRPMCGRASRTWDEGAPSRMCCFSDENPSADFCVSRSIIPGLAPSATGAGSIAPAFSRQAINLSRNSSQRPQ